MNFFDIRSDFQHRSAFLGILIAGFLLAPFLSASAPQPCVTELFVGDPEFFGGDGGAAIDAQLDEPRALALAPDGSLYLTDRLNQNIRHILPNGIIETVYSADGEVK